MGFAAFQSKLTPKQTERCRKGLRRLVKILANHDQCAGLIALGIKTIWLWSPNASGVCLRYDARLPSVALPHTVGRQRTYVHKNFHALLRELLSDPERVEEDLIQRYGVRGFAVDVNRPREQVYALCQRPDGSLDPQIVTVLRTSEGIFRFSCDSQ